MDAGLALEKLGAVAVVLLAAGTLVAPAARQRALAAAGALLLTPVLLVVEIWDTPQFATIRDHPAAAIAAGLLALLAVAVAGRALAVRPGAYAIAAVAALPFRIPVESAGSTANLLVPLYVVIAAGSLAWIVPALRGSAQDADGRERGRLEQLLAAALVLYGLQAAYSSDFSKALENLVFFYVPFALLFAALVRIVWTPRLVAACFGVLLGLALVLVGIGFWEYQARELLLNPKVIDSNAFSSYFRVNSLFFDPNIYGRFLAVVMVLVTAVLLWTPRPGRAGLCALALAVLWAGLVVTFSQSSFGALLAGLAVLGALRWSPRGAIAIAVAVVVAGAVLVVAAPGAVRLDLESNASIDKATSGRFDLVSGGTRLFGDRPIWGYGPGAFAREYRRHEHASGERAASASHTIPVTVAAEQGIVGVLVYLALVVSALLVLFRGARGDPLRAAIAAAFAAIVLHTMFYAAFLEDPITWALLAAGVALAAGGAGVREPRVPQDDPPLDAVATA